MNPHCSLQDVIRCHLCETPNPSKHCDICHVHLCEDCEEEHTSDESSEHHIVSFKMRGSTPKCLKHPTKYCILHCEQCNIPICTLCDASREHEKHDIENILKTFAHKKQLIEKDLQELEKSIYPQYQEAALSIPVQRTNLGKNSQKLTTALNNLGEVLHSEIDTIIMGLQSEINDRDNQLLVALDKQEEVINRTRNEISQITQKLKKLDTNDVRLVSEYKSRNEELRELPSELEVSIPKFNTQHINRKNQTQSGSFYYLYLEMDLEKQDDTLQSPAGADSSQQDRPLLDVPIVITDISTGQMPLYGVSCLSDEEMWTLDNSQSMKLYNLQGELVNSVQTISANNPRDIAVTRKGDLVYTDEDDRSINLVSDSQIQPLIKLGLWRPLFVCSTSSDDLLVLMASDDYKETKVVRYFGSTKKQSIQWDDQGQPLYSSDTYTKYLSENKNLDICVADNVAGAVVVVNAAGKLRFKYTDPHSDTVGSFKPLGITTDSQGKILTADTNHNIHIVDQDGNLLRYIDCNGLFRRLWGLCVDSRNNLFVAVDTGKVKKIQYYV